jgi:hypothetical protein
MFHALRQLSRQPSFWNGDLFLCRSRSEYIT